MAESSSRKKDYSSQVRKKLANSSRTGQACDRCKLRKIRCDADPNGCAGCRAAAEPCETTDRITRKAFRRGHTDQLEVENIHLKSKVQELQQKLLDLGVSLSPIAYDPESGTGDDDHPSLDPHSASSTNLNDGNRRPSLASSADVSIWQKHMNNISGSVSTNPAFSMLRGTKLSLFGMQIDLAEFAEDFMDMDSPQTFSGFIYHANASNAKEHLVAPSLPPNLKQAREYASWYFSFLNSYTPVLDKRDMDKLLTEVYNDPRPGPRPGRTAADEVIVHMMFAYIKYQYGQRNKLQQMTDEAMAHFKYSISFIQDLLRARTFRDIQAMSLIVLQLRGLRRPGACWIHGQLTVHLAVECGLHRSADSMAASERQQLDPNMIEARKRVFWALYGLVTNNSTRLGRPPPLRLTDIDIEFPLPVHDFLDGEEQSLTEFQKCSFQVGVVIAKLLALFSDLHCTFYTLCKPPASEYAKLVARFKNDLEAWHANVPQEISDASRAENELTMYAMYLDLFEAEFRFLLYHPLLHPPNQPASYKRNLQACEEAISDALRLLLKIRDLNSLDVPWHTTTLLLSMTFTQLFIGDQRSAEATETSYKKLESDMGVWLDLFGTVGNMLGSGTRLQTSVGQIIKNVLDKLKAGIGRVNTPSSAGTSTGSFSMAKGFGLRMVPDIKHETQGTYGVSALQGLTAPGQNYTMTPAQAQAQATFASYENAQGVYNASQTTYNTVAYAAASTQPKPVPSTPLGSTVAYSTPGGMTYYATQDGSTSTQTTTPATDWMRWSQANLNPFAQATQHDYITPSAATTLMSMSDTSSTAGAAAVQTADHSQHWPLNYYSSQYATTHPG